MRESLRLATVALALGVGLTGCLYQDLEVLEVEAFSDLSFSLQGMQAQMNVDVFNPNPYAVKVTGADVKLYVDEAVVGDVTVREITTIRPEARATVPLHVRTREGALREVLKHDLMNLIRGTDVAFTAKGEVTGKAFGLSFTVPLKHDQTLNTQP